MIVEYNGVANKSRIYKITNIHNGQIYIGQAEIIKQRWNDYKNNLPKVKFYTFKGWRFLNPIWERAKKQKSAVNI